MSFTIGSPCSTCGSVTFPCDCDRAPVPYIEFAAMERRAVAAEEELRRRLLELAGVKRTTTRLGKDLGAARSRRDRVINQNVTLRANLLKWQRSYKVITVEMAEVKASVDALQTIVDGHETHLAEFCGKLIVLLREVQAEISYWHGPGAVLIGGINYLSDEERSHPRGNGWARVWDKIGLTLDSLRATMGRGQSRARQPQD